MVDAIRRLQPIIKRACYHTGSNPVLTTKIIKHEKYNNININDAHHIIIFPNGQDKIWLELLFRAIFISKIRGEVNPNFRENKIII